MNHKRKRPRRQRAGCKMCKPWKLESGNPETADGEAHSDQVRRLAAQADILLEQLPEEDDTNFKDPDYEYPESAAAFGDNTPWKFEFRRGKVR